MKEILIETSARHVHVNQADLNTLFGEGHVLTQVKDLSQPGQFASKERVTVVGPKRELANVSILGPCRGASQIEISATDARSIGVDAPIRESGDIGGSASVKLVGPIGEAELKEGCIIAKRHIHLDPATAEKYGVINNQNVKVSCGENGRKLIFDDVVVRVHESFAPAMHLDTDEANAAGCPVKGIIICD